MSDLAKKVQFIKAKNYSQEKDYAPAVCFRKRFTLEKKGKYTVSVCLLGLGYVYINGKAVANDLFLSPVSDYRKTLWMNEYDVTKLLKNGENELYIELGNGFYNEGVETVWGHHTAKWRANPTCWLSLKKDGEEVLATDESWETTISKKTYFNELRSGEYFDARVEKEEDWSQAVINDTPPTGEMRLCECEPILEQERLSPVKIIKNKNGWVFDFGKNIAGYTEICVKEELGKEITLRFAEELDENNELKLNGLDVYQHSPFQTDKLICNGKKVVWKPKFTYHGFQYVEVVGLTNKPPKSLLTAISTYQNIQKQGDFVCSNETINKIYQAGIASTRANTFYSLTDCPTREKLGWMNDTVASLEQVFFNFDAYKLLRKWFVDILESMREDGDMTGVAPSPDWGLGHGPICSSAVFIFPYFMYKYCGDKEIVALALPYMKRYNAYLLEHLDEFHLGDWTGADFLPTPKMFIARVYLFVFASIFNALGEDYSEQYNQAKKRLEDYIENGKCTVEEQSAISALIALGIGDKNALEKQLIECIEKFDRHIACGMFGVQFLYKALIKIGRVDLAYAIVMNDTAPSFKNWIDRGSTTLWETFDENARSISKNHHMFSNVLYFFVEGLCGLLRKSENEFSLQLQPISELDFVKCERKTKDGKLSVSWKRTKKGVEVFVKTTGKAVVEFNGKKLANAKETFLLEDKYGA